MAILEIMDQLRRQGSDERDPAALMNAAEKSPFWSGFRLPSTPQIFTGLDIGTTKVCAIIGEIHPRGQVTILGVASTPSQGLRRGVVINLDETIDSVRTAIRKAEEIAQLRVRDVFVGIAGGHIRCHQVSAEVQVANPERGVSRHDIRRVIERAVSGQSSVEREIIERIPQRFHVDDGWIVDPENFASRKLGVDLLVVTAAVTSAQNIVRAVDEAGYRVSSIYLEPLASSLAILTQREKELGVVMIDIGGGTSDIAIWAEDAVRFTDVVPFGGDAVTEDIAKGLKITRYDAENLKKRHGNSIAASVDPAEKIDIPIALTGDATTVSRQFLAEVIEARMEEILEMAREKVEKLAAYEYVQGGIVLTGGAALLPGLSTLAERIFKKPCKIGYPTGLSGLSSVVSSPIYSTGVGLLLYGLEHEREQALLEGNTFSRIVRKFKDISSYFH